MRVHCIFSKAPLIQITLFSRSLSVAEIASQELRYDNILGNSIGHRSDIKLKA